MPKQEKEVHFGDGVREGAMQTINKRLTKTANSIIESLFDEVDANAKDLPSDIKDCIAKVRDYFNQQGNEPRLEPNTEGNTKRKLRAFKPMPVAKPKIEGSIKQQKSVAKISPDDPNLPPELRVFVARLEGFHEGMYFEYQLAMLALVDNNAPKELIVAVRDYLKEKGRRWDDRDREKIEQQYNEQKYLWDE